MEIINKDIKYCDLCDNWVGWVHEKYNGRVRVLCRCIMEEESNHYGHWIGPVMLCPDGDKLWWIPKSEHYESDGICWHTPYFAGPFPNSKSK